MECNTTSIKNSRLGRIVGATLVEFMVALGIGSIVLLVLAALMSYTARGFAAVINYIDLDQKGRNALDKITTQIRQVDSLASISSNQISFRINGTNIIQYVYDPAGKTLSVISNAQQTVLLPQCDACTFAIFQRNTVTNTFDQFPTSLGSNTCKLVQFSWVCSRQIFGQKVNTESAQSAKIVIRREH